MFAAAPLRKGQYVLEYKTERVYRREDRVEEEREYVENGESCMVFDVQTSEGWFTLDATRRFDTVGRLMNHASARVATVVPYKPLRIKKKLRLPFLAARDIDKGEELTWDYGCRPEGQTWLMRVRTKPASEGTYKNEPVREFLWVLSMYAVLQWRLPSKTRQRSQWRLPSKTQQRSQWRLPSKTEPLPLKSDHPETVLVNDLKAIV